MNFLLDNNLPPALARALDALCTREGHHVIALIDKFAPNTPDVKWIGTLRLEGNWVIVSQDKFRKGTLETVAIRASGLAIFCLAKHWSNETYWNKAWNLVRWWPLIQQQAELIAGGAAFRVPWKYSQKGKFEQIVM